MTMQQIGTDENGDPIMADIPDYGNEAANPWIGGNNALQPQPPGSEMVISGDGTTLYYSTTDPKTGAVTYEDASTGEVASPNPADVAKYSGNSSTWSIGQTAKDMAAGLGFKDVSSMLTNSAGLAALIAAMNQNTQTQDPAKQASALYAVNHGLAHAPISITNIDGNKRSFDPYGSISVKPMTRDQVAYTGNPTGAGLTDANGNPTQGFSSAAVPLDPNTIKSAFKAAGIDANMGAFGGWMPSGPNNVNGKATVNDLQQALQGMQYKNMAGGTTYNSANWNPTLHPLDQTQQQYNDAVNPVTNPGGNTAPYHGAVSGDMYTPPPKAQGGLMHFADGGSVPASDPNANTQYVPSAVNPAYVDSGNANASVPSGTNNQPLDLSWLRGKVPGFGSGGVVSAQDILNNPIFKAQNPNETADQAAALAAYYNLPGTTSSFQNDINKTLSSQIGNAYTSNFGTTATPASSSTLPASTPGSSDQGNWLDWITSHPTGVAANQNSGGWTQANIDAAIKAAGMGSTLGSIDTNHPDTVNAQLATKALNLAGIASPTAAQTANALATYNNSANRGETLQQYFDSIKAQGAGGDSGNGGGSAFVPPDTTHNTPAPVPVGGSSTVNTLPTVAPLVARRSQIPFTGDFLHYGEGPEHLFFDTVNPLYSGTGSVWDPSFTGANQKPTQSNESLSYVPPTQGQSLNPDPLNPTNAFSSNIANGQTNPGAWSWWNYNNPAGQQVANSTGVPIGSTLTPAQITKMYADQGQTVSPGGITYWSGQPASALQNAFTTNPGGNTTSQWSAQNPGGTTAGAAHPYYPLPGASTIPGSANQNVPHATGGLAHFAQGGRVQEFSIGGYAQAAEDARAAQLYSGVGVRPGVYADPSSSTGYRDNTGRAVDPKTGDPVLDTAQQAQIQAIQNWHSGYTGQTAPINSAAQNTSSQNVPFYTGNGYHTGVYTGSGYAGYTSTGNDPNLGTGNSLDASVLPGNNGYSVCSTLPEAGATTAPAYVPTPNDLSKTWASGDNTGFVPGGPSAQPAATTVAQPAATTVATPAAAGNYDTSGAWHTGAGTQAGSYADAMAMLHAQYGGVHAATGGAIQRGGLSALQHGPRMQGHIQGPGTGQSDSIPAVLSNGEYVVDSGSVADLGDGSTDAGAKVLDKMRENLRRHKRSAPPSKIPPKAKTPEQYMKGGRT